ncbi:hypothetical protein V8D89_010172 [Ganoderma adspersum]
MSYSCGEPSAPATHLFLLCTQLRSIYIRSPCLYWIDYIRTKSYGPFAVHSYCALFPCSLLDGVVFDTSL